MNYPHTTRSALLATALLITSFGAHAQDEAKQDAKTHNLVVKDYLGKERIIYDSDGDGWDDLWCALHPDLKHRNKSIDTDADKLTDYEEMIMWRDPFVEGPLPRELTPEEIAEGERDAADAGKRRIEAMEVRKEQLAPYIISPLAKNDGRAASAAEVDAEKLPKLAALAQKNAADTAAAERRAATFAQRYGIAKDSVGPDGQVQSLIDVVDGVPQFNITHNAAAADSISTDEVRPGGSLGLNLTGGGTAVAFTEVANNGAGRLRLSMANSSSFTVGQSATISGATVAAYNGTWPVVAIALGTIDVDRAFTATATGSVSAPVTMGVWDGGDVFTTHQEFTTGGQRVTDRDGVSPLGISGHATHVSGTMAGRGASLPARGMAYNASLHAYDWLQDRVDMPTAAGIDGIRISNHSYGPASGWGTAFINGANRLAWFGDTTISTTEDYRYGFYDIITRQIDQIAYDAPNYLSIWSAGNERGSTGPATQPVGHYANQGDALWVWFPSTVRPLDGGATGFDTIAREGVAKNVLTVAAVEDLVGGWTAPAGVGMSAFSSFGSCDDGRIKPDISANGVLLTSPWSTGTTNYNSISGTSMAAPSVAGSAALLVEHYMNLFGGNAQLRSATLKGLLIHTADEAGAFVGPDYQFGWGLMNTRSATALLTAQHASDAALRHLKQIVLNNGDFIEFQVRAIGGQPLRVTIVWTDPAGIVPPRAVDVDLDGTRALVNDLDLRMFAGATEHFPWRLDPANQANAATRTGDNTRDNVEQALIDAPAAGQIFTVRVTHKGTLVDDTGATAPTGLTMHLSGVVADPAPDFRILDISPTGIDEHTLTWSSVVGATYRLESSTELTAGTWTELAGDFVAVREFTSAEVFNATGEFRRFWRVKRLP